MSLKSRYDKMQFNHKWGIENQTAKNQSFIPI